MFAAHVKKRKEEATGGGFRGFSLLSGQKKHKRVFAQAIDPQRSDTPVPLQVRPDPPWPLHSAFDIDFVFLFCSPGR